MSKKHFRKLNILSIISLIFLLILPNLSVLAIDFADNDPVEPRIEVTTIEGQPDVTQGHPTVELIPGDKGPIQEVQFSAKAHHEVAFYPYAPTSTEPYAWSWPTGAPHVPDGKYTLRMDIVYESGEEEAVLREIYVKNYVEPNFPESPTELTASGTASEVNLSWKESSSNRLFDYVIYINDEKIATTQDLEYTLTDLELGAVNEIRVKARDIYNNVSLDSNTIGIDIPVDGNSEISTLPIISEIIAPEPNGASAGSQGYAGSIELKVQSLNKEVEQVKFYVKTVDSDESTYWQFPNVVVENNEYSIIWDTTSAPEGQVIIKAEAYDEIGQSSQFTTVSSVLLVNNEADAVEPPSWDPADNPPESRIVGYVMGESTYGSFDFLRDIDASRLTHLNYAFGYISDDLELVLNDYENDIKNFRDLALLKEEYPHLKTMISVGGWGGSANFSEAAATKESRKTFANSAVEFIVEYGFDGVDLDWEYPVTGGGPGTYPNPADEENFPLLLEKIREKLDEQGKKDDTHYLLTIAGAANTGFIKNATIGETHEYLDYVQVMTYDIHGTWETLADFTAPLYDDDGKTWSVDKAILAYLEAGVPAEKIVMGVPFYGYSYTVTSNENNGLRQPFGASGAITYGQIVNRDLLNNGYERYWDEGTQVPYLFNEEESIFISYDDEESIALKAGYINENDLGGAMIWQLAQDHGNDLLDTLYTVLAEKDDSSEDPKNDIDKLKEELSELIDSIQAEELNENNFTAESWNALEAALDVAITILDKSDATKEEVEQALNELLVARENLVEEDSEPLVDKNKLQNKVDSLKEENLNPQDFDAKDWKAFAEAFTAAEKILADENATQDQVDEALEKLINSYEALTIKGPLDKGDDSKKGTEHEKDSNGKPLPKTATAMYNYILLGLFILGGGITTFFVARRRKKMQ